VIGECLGHARFLVVLRSYVTDIQAPVMHPVREPLEHDVVFLEVLEDESRQRGDSRVTSAVDRRSR
jgi:hypothetical protein